jgi:hypothetical protein
MRRIKKERIFFQSKSANSEIFFSMHKNGRPPRISETRRVYRLFNGFSPWWNGGTTTTQWWLAICIAILQ